MSESLVTPTPGVFIFVISLFFGLMAFIGYYSTKKTKTLQDFFVMSGKAGILMSGFAYFATQYSMSTFMGVPGNIYHAGYAGMTVSVPGLSFSMIIPALIVGRRLMYLGKKNGFLTMADYVGDRYDSSGLRIFLAVMMLILMIPLMGAQMIGAGVIFKTYTGYGEWVGVLAMGIIVIFYCMAGGIRGAMTTDIIQGGLMLATAITAFIVSVKIGGGLENINEKLLSMNEKYLSHPGIKNNYPFLGYVSMIVMWSFFTIGQPHLFTKFFSMKNYQVLFKATILGTLGMWLSASLIEWVGVNGIVSVPGLIGKDSDYIVPIVLQKGLPSWLAALMVAGIFSAGMSTVSSILIVTTSALSRDLYQRVFVKDATDAQTLYVSRLITILLGIFAIIFGIFKPDSIFKIILAVVGGWGIWTSAIVMGMYWKRANKYGAFAGIIAGEFAYLFITFSKMYASSNPGVENIFTKTVSAYSKFLPGLSEVIPCFFVAILFIVLFSLITNPPKSETIKRHFEL